MGAQLSDSPNIVTIIFALAAAGELGRPRSTEDLMSNRNVGEGGSNDVTGAHIIACSAGLRRSPAELRGRTRFDVLRASCSSSPSTKSNEDRHLICNPSSLAGRDFTNQPDQALVLCRHCGQILPSSAGGVPGSRDRPADPSRTLYLAYSGRNASPGRR